MRPALRFIATWHFVGCQQRVKEKLMNANPCSQIDEEPKPREADNLHLAQLPTKCKLPIRDKNIYAGPRLVISSGFDYE